MLQKNLKIYGIDVGAGEICDKLEKENKFVQEEVTSGNYKAEYNYKDKYNIVIHKNATSFMPSYTYDIYKIESSSQTYYASTAYNLRPIIANWYNILRDISIVGMLSILVYVGIRIMLSSTAGDKAKYKQLLVDWVVAICLLFLMQYIMSFSNIAVKKVTSVIQSAVVSTTESDKLSANEKKAAGEKGKLDGDVAVTRGTQLFEIEDKELVKKAYQILVEENKTDTDYSKLFTNEGSGSLYWPTNNFTEQARMLAQLTDKDDDATNYAYASIGYKIIYIVLVLYTLIFTWTYVKRVVYMAFLTMIAPLVALTYPIDKMNDGKAQAFNMWFKEYIFNLLIQPLHLILYMVLIGSAMTFASRNLIYAVVAIGFMTPAEKLMRKFFGFEKAGTPGMFAGPAGAALMMGGINKLLRPPHPPKGGGGPSGGGSENDSDDGGDGKINFMSDKVDTDGMFKIGNGDNDNANGQDAGAGVPGISNNTTGLGAIGGTGNGLPGNGSSRNGVSGNGLPGNGSSGNELSSSLTGRSNETQNSQRTNPNTPIVTDPRQIRKENRKRKLKAMNNARKLAGKRFVKKAGAKKPIRRALGVATGVLGATAAATAAGVASIVSGDPTKIAQNMMTAGVGGYALTKGIPSSISDTGENLYNGAKQFRDDYRADYETVEEQKIRAQDELIKQKREDPKFQTQLNNLTEGMSRENLDENMETCIRHGLSESYQIAAIQQMVEDGVDINDAMGRVKVAESFGVDTSSSSLDAETNQKINESLAHRIEKTNGLQAKDYEPISEDEIPPDLTPDMTDEEKQLRKGVLARNRERWAQREARKQEEYSRQQIVKNSTEGVRKQVDATNKLLYEKRKLYNKK